MVASKKSQMARRLRRDPKVQCSFFNQKYSPMVLLLVVFLLTPSTTTAWLSHPPTALVSVSRSISFVQGLELPPYSSKVVRPSIHPRTTTTVTTTITALGSDRFNRDLEERSNRRAQGKGVGGEIAAGVILGGLIMGPFGALFGAQMGANFGAKNAVERARKEEMERLGVSQDMLDAAQDIGLALQQSFEGLEATRASLETQQSLARRLDRDATELYEKAKIAMTSTSSSGSSEDEARKFLLKRTEVQDKLKSVLVQCAADKRRMETMEENVRVIEARALEVDALLQRTVGATARQNASIEMGDFSLSREDPLLQKFRDLGIK